MNFISRLWLPRPSSFQWSCLATNLSKGGKYWCLKLSPLLRLLLGTIQWHVFSLMLQSSSSGLAVGVRGGPCAPWTQRELPSLRLLYMLSAEESSCTNCGWWSPTCSSCWHSRESFEALVKVIVHLIHLRAVCTYLTLVFRRFVASKHCQATH